MRKKKKKSSFFQKFFSFIIVILSLFLIGAIIFLNVLDFIHLWFVMIIVGIFDMIFLFMLKRRKIFGYLLNIIYIVVLCFLCFNVGKTVNFLKDLDLNYKTYNYSVVVLKNSKIKKISDIYDKKMAYYDDGSQENDKALDKVRKKVEIEVVPYEDTHKMAMDLLDGKVDSMLLENSYLDILNESIESGESSFNDNIRKIYGFVVFTKTNDISKDINVTKEPFNVYISGIDTFGEISSVSRSDVNMIVTVNPQTQQILLTSIPRDYYVKLHGRSGYRDKLTHAGLYGVDMSIQTIEDLLDIDINYYVKVNFSSVVNIVNALDGVRVYSDKEFTSIDNYHYSQGYNDLNGEEALSFARERKAFLTGDRQRIRNQQALLSAIFDKVTSKTIITKYAKFLDSINGSFVTNMKTSRLTSFVRLQLENNYSWNLIMNSLAGLDSKNYTYSASSVKSYVMNPIDDSVSYAHELIDDVINGEVLDRDVVSEESKKASQGTSSVVNEVVPNKESSSNNKTVVEDKKVDVKEKVQDEKKVNDSLVVKLGRENVEFVEGGTFVYYGYVAKFGDKDITDSSELVEHFTILGETFDDYKDLVLYVSRLNSGKYTITYTIEYKGYSNILIQSVVILPKEKEEENDEKEETIDENDEKKSENG